MSTTKYVILKVFNYDDMPKRLKKYFFKNYATFFSSVGYEGFDLFSEEDRMRCERGEIEDKRDLLINDWLIKNGAIYEDRKVLIYYNIEAELENAQK